MFTGIIHQTGRIKALEETDSGRKLQIHAENWQHQPAIGSSIAINGCCLTVTNIDAANAILDFDVIFQTLRETTIGMLQPGDIINLEHAATPSTLLDGHIVQGHIDGVGSAKRLKSDDPGEVRLQITPPTDLMPFFIPRGSVTIDGVSLTLADVAEQHFEVALIPTTLEWTNLDRIKDDAVSVNIETDCLVRAVIHHLSKAKWGSAIENRA